MTLQPLDDEPEARPRVTGPSRGTLEQHIRVAFPERIRGPVTTEQIRRIAVLTGARPAVLSVLDTLDPVEPFHWHQQVLAPLTSHLDDSNR